MTVKVDPKICDGKPHIKGKDYPIYKIIKAFGEDKGFDDIIKDAKDEGVKLTVKDIRDALLYTIKVVRKS